MKKSETESPEFNDMPLELALEKFEDNDILGRLHGIVSNSHADFDDEDIHVIAKLALVAAKTFEAAHG